MLGLSCGVVVLMEFFVLTVGGYVDDGLGVVAGEGRGGRRWREVKDGASGRESGGAAGHECAADRGAQASAGGDTIHGHSERRANYIAGEEHFGSAGGGPAGAMDRSRGQYDFGVGQSDGRCEEAVHWDGERVGYSHPHCRGGQGRRCR